MKAAYVNAIGGASGDMLLASLVDSGLDVARLSSALTTVGIEGFQLEALVEDRRGVKGTHLNVNINIITSNQAKNVLKIVMKISI